MLPPNLSVGSAARLIVPKILVHQGKIQRRGGGTWGRGFIGMRLSACMKIVYFYFLGAHWISQVVATI